MTIAKRRNNAGAVSLGKAGCASVMADDAVLPPVAANAATL
ncbi:MULTISPECIES: hypothetical protein [unclassified Mesorhizobium]|nr:MULTISPECIES: hypothetical protein [unclassified Mesorhizobium]